MPLQQKPVDGYFTTRRVGAGNVPTLILSASDGGSPVWVYDLRDATFEGIRDALTAFLDATLERNVTPIIDSRVYAAPEQLGLGFSIAEAVYAGCQAANAPLVEWAALVERIDRIAFELERLRFMVELWRAQQGG